MEKGLQNIDTTFEEFSLNFIALKQTMIKRHILSSAKYECLQDLFCLTLKIKQLLLGRIKLKSLLFLNV